MELTPGLRLHSATSTAQVVIVKCPSGDVDLRCGGHPMSLTAVEAPVPPSEGLDGELALGKRYGNADGSLLLLVTKPGVGTLAIAGDPLQLHDARALPASD